MSEDQDKQGSELSLTDQDRRLLAALDDLPAVSRPWEAVAEQFGCSVSDLLDKVRTWREGGYLRHLRALFNGERLGYQSTLAAMGVAVEKADDVAVNISALPYVSHNFLRDRAELNLWFTLACPVRGPTLEETIEEIARTSKGVVRRFDVVKTYKISFRSLFHSSRDAVRRDEDPAPAKDLPESVLLDAIGALQTDLPLADRPFLELARNGGLGEDQLLDAVMLLKQHKVLRRIGAIWNINRLSFASNVMGTWDLPDEQIDAFGTEAAKEDRISHCYQRTHYPDWPWKIYTMIHGRNRHQCIGVVESLTDKFPKARSLLLWTIKEYKQSPVTYDRDKILLRL